MTSGYRKCRLTRLTDNGHTRTPVIEGECRTPPQFGKSFKVWNDKPLDPSTGANMRLVETTPVMWVETVFDQPSALKFQTESGTDYKWEEL